MRTEDATVPETTAHLEAGQDEIPDLDRIEHLAEETQDSGLRRELESSIANGQASSRTFQRSRDRFWMAFFFGR